MESGEFSGNRDFDDLPINPAEVLVREQSNGRIPGKTHEALSGKEAKDRYSLVGQGGQLWLIDMDR